MNLLTRAGRRIRSLIASVLRSPEEGAFRPGHYYSSVPSREDVERGLRAMHAPPLLVDIDLQRAEQFALLQQLAHYYPDQPFSDEPQDGLRYHFNPAWFGHSDAILLHAFLRHFRPQRIVEIGSGFSSAVMLDTADRFPGCWSQVTFIEPDPNRLLALLKPEDQTRVTLLRTPAQEIDRSIFTALKCGDLLFIDSSHVLKFGSDLHRILFDILPSLSVGVHVHFHDIFFPFEYPAEWLQDGRYWNECYFIRAFLSGNRNWKITLFNQYVHAEFPDFIEQKLPLCRKSFGGSLYLTRIA
ncbi:MAG TPA: class I SAM-dependent methyltransferase [Opitutaceae bacterium]